MDRNTIELLNQLRVAGTRVQVIFAFLLIVAFNNRFKILSAFVVGVLTAGFIGGLWFVPPLARRASE